MKEDKLTPEQENDSDKKQDLEIETETSEKDIELISKYDSTSDGEEAEKDIDTAEDGNSSLRKQLIDEMKLDSNTSSSRELSRLKMSYLLQTINWRHELRNFMYCFIGCFICSIGIHIFYNPLQLTLGGISGVASIIYQLTGRGAFLSFGTLVAILNIPPLIVGWVTFSWRFVWRSVIGSFLYSAWLIVTEPLMKNWFVDYLNKPTMNGSPDILIYCVFGGIIFGFGIGIVMRGGYTTGGSDILGVAIHHKFKRLSVGKMVLFVDGAVVLSTLFFYREQANSVLLAMYSLVSMVISARFTDFALEGMDRSRLAFIVTNESKAIATAIFIELNRGATELKAKGMYSGEDRPVIYCVLSNRQIPRLKEIVKEIDPKAFVAISEAREVQGEGFANSLQEFM